MGVAGTSVNGWTSSIEHIGMVLGGGEGLRLVEGQLSCWLQSTDRGFEALTKVEGRKRGGFVKLGQHHRNSNGRSSWLGHVNGAF